MEPEKDFQKEEKIKEIQKKKQNKILATLLLICATFFIAFLAWIMVSQSTSHFEYRGVEFDIVKEIAPYRTAIPIFLKNSITGGATSETQYYFYLRNDPRELDKIPFTGKFTLTKEVAVKSEKDFNCEGQGALAAANAVNLYKVLGIKLIKDPAVECDEQGRYAVWNLVEGEKTEIKEISPACYEITINNCEILKAQERIMVETFVEFNKVKDQVKIEI